MLYFYIYWFIFQIRSISVYIRGVVSCLLQWSGGAEGTGDYDGTNHSLPFPLHSLQSRQEGRKIVFTWFVSFLSMRVGGS